MNREPRAPEPIILPEGYYLDHFRDFIRSVGETYLDILGESERALVLGFQGLPFPEQQLFARLSNRTKTVFFRSSLEYPEIDALPSVVDSLLERGFLKRPDESDVALCLESLTKAQLMKLAPAGMKKLRVLPKQELLARLQTETDFETFRISPLYNDIVIRQFVEELRYLLFLAFGNTRSDLKLYTLRDMGIRRSSGRASGFGRRFETGEEARSEYAYRRLRDDLRELPADVLAAKLGSESFPKPIGSGAVRVRDKLILECAQSLLRAKDSDRALRLLELGSGELVVEKRVRLLHSLGKLEAVNVELEEIFRNPVSAGLFFFAEEFAATRLGRVRRSALSTVLKESVKIRLNAKYRGRPELGAIDYLSHAGSRAYHTENRLWTALFGILFWPELFEAPGAALFSEFDLIPRDLVDRTFFARNLDAIEQRLGELESPTRAIEIINSVWEAHYGAPNGIFSWSSLERELLVEFVEGCCAIKADIGTVLRSLARNFEDHRRGFPDLLVFTDGRPGFVEVKSLGDKLHPAQLRQLRLLADCGFETKIIRTEWEYEPEQVYVVIDVETTGTIASRNRVIEIGAVKIQNGNIIDRFSTLVHPECRIPRLITGLTGITNEMVAAAPRFAEIGSDLTAFIGDGLFVGHNARFDYSFIVAELERAGIEFRAPIFCTAQEMRATYPRIDSYSLDALCREFSVPLERHHRALCDAEATAQLLLILLQTGAYATRSSTCLESSPSALTSSADAAT